MPYKPEFSDEACDTVAWMLGVSSREDVLIIADLSDAVWNLCFAATDDAEDAHGAARAVLEDAVSLIDESFSHGYDGGRYR